MYGDVIGMYTVHGEARDRLRGVAVGRAGNPRGPVTDGGSLQSKFGFSKGGVKCKYGVRYGCIVAVLIQVDVR